MHFLALLLLFLLAAPSYGHSDPDCRQPIKFGALTWESGQFTTALLRIIIEKGYGCPTEEVTGAAIALENGLIQNDIQVIAEIWEGRSEVIDNAIMRGEVQVIGDTLKGGAQQGWYVPDYVQQQYPQLQSVWDLANFADLFTDPNDLQHARFLNCPSGWSCEIFNANLLRNLNFSRRFNNVLSGTGAALDAEISAYYEKRQPLLFYYWQPTGLMAKYRFVPLKFPAYNADCWADLLKEHTANPCISGFPVSKLAIAVSAQFQQKQTALLDLFRRIRLEPHELNRAILEMTEQERSGEQQALHFLQNYPERWRHWVSKDAEVRLKKTLFASDETDSVFPQWSIENRLNQALKLLVQGYGDHFRYVGLLLQTYLLNPVEQLFVAVPAWLFILLTAALAWCSTKRLAFTLFTLTGLFFIAAFGLWEALMFTVALMSMSVLFTICFGVPLGIWLAARPRCYRLVLPILDVMQTMPSFVYLIPVLMLFGLGKVPAMLASIIYAIVPLIRLTVLGIRQVDMQLIEASRDLGANRWNLLRFVILPLAKPQIMVGINQTVMMSLSMVVLASMIGASGLGEIILQAIQTLNVGKGLQAGSAIVVLAIIVDRITQAFGQRNSG